MARPAKAVKIIKLEGRSHRTKQELAIREKAEQDLATGNGIRELPEVKDDPYAHKWFLYVRRIFKALDKYDDLYTGSLNTYCLVCAEIDKLSEDSRQCMEEIADLRARRDDFEDAEQFYSLLTMMNKHLDSVDRRIDQKRKIKMSLERENGMTVSSALRSIPKKPDQTAGSKLKEALYGT